jgi:hypothetical protein
MQYMNFISKDSISFDIQISVPSLPEVQRRINILDLKNLDTSHYSSFVNGRRGISTYLEITFGTMKLATQTEYLGSILSWCLESIFAVFAGRHYIGWSQTMYSTYRVVFDSYNELGDFYHWDIEYEFREFNDWIVGVSRKLSKSEIELVKEVAKDAGCLECIQSNGVWSLKNHDPLAKDKMEAFLPHLQIEILVGKTTAPNGKVIPKGKYRVFIDELKKGKF